MSFGIFNDEGLLEGDFDTAAEAQAVRDREYNDCDNVVAVQCHDHPEHAAATCEACNAEEV